MNRRNFLKNGSALVLGSTLVDPHNFLPRFNKGERDQYGGWTGLKFEATGFFHLVKGKRWWLVTPE
ncbi:MAG: hypothetical protein DRI70_09855, partial [Bacteroidetes bacterium]